LSLPGTTQDIEQHENNCELANHKCYFECKSGLLNRGYGAEKMLGSGWIWAREIRVVQVAGFRSMQSLRGRIAGNDDIRIVAKPLQAAIPNIAMDIIIGARGQPKKCNVPRRSQDEPNDDNASWKYRRDEKLTDRQEVHDARNRQRGHKVWPTPIAEVA
jgi:hypothetical protein